MESRSPRSDISRFRNSETSSACDACRWPTSALIWAIISILIVSLSASRILCTIALIACCASGDESSSVMFTLRKDDMPERLLEPDACELERLAADGERRGLAFLVFTWMTCPAAPPPGFGGRPELLVRGLGGRGGAVQASDRLELLREDGVGDGPVSPFERLVGCSPAGR